MSPESIPRRRVIRYLGGGAVAGSTAVYGLGNAFTQNAQAQVGLEFEDATVDLPADDTIDDLRVTGDVSGEFDTGGGPSESVIYYLTVEMDEFGGFEDMENRQPDEASGTVDWAPTYSLMEKTELDSETVLVGGSFDNNTTAYDVTASVRMEVYADGSQVAQAQDGATGTITFRNPGPDGTPDNGTDTEGDPDADADASVSISFGFDVDK